MKILAIDPGSEQSAWCIFDGAGVRGFGKSRNFDVRAFVMNAGDALLADVLAIEMIASYGMPVGREVFETCVWIGRFVEAWGGACEYVYRRDVKLHLCGSVRAKDSNVRSALIDRFGPGRAKAVGTKSKPGPLYGVSNDVWSALAVGVVYGDGVQKRAAGAS